MLANDTTQMSPPTELKSRGTLPPRTIDEAEEDQIIKMLAIQQRKRLE